MNDFIWFFKPSIGAHFVTMLMELCSLYDKRDNLTIHSTLREVEKIRGLDKRKIQGAKRRIRKIRPLLLKLFILRNNVIAHISKKLDPSDAFDKADLTISNLKTIVNDTQKILNQLALASGNLPRDLPGSAEIHTREVLTLVKRGNSLT